MIRLVLWMALVRMVMVWIIVSRHEEVQTIRGFCPSRWLDWNPIPRTGNFQIGKRPHGFAHHAVAVNRFSLSQ